MPTTFVFQAISDNATRREQEAVAAQRRAMREAEEELKRKMAANGGKRGDLESLWHSRNLFINLAYFPKVEGSQKMVC